jgi:hypothetical protein
MFRAFPEPDECDVGSQPGRYRCNIRDLELARDHLVAHPGHDLSGRFQAFSPLIGDQNAKVFMTLRVH